MNPVAAAYKMHAGIAVLIKDLLQYSCKLLIITVNCYNT